MAELYDPATFEQVGFGNADAAETESVQRIEDSLCVRWRRPDEEVDVPGERG